MTDQETLKLALEALHGSIAITMAKIDLRNKAIKALEEALAKQEQGEPVEWNDREDEWTDEIAAHHPLKTKAYAQWDTAMAMVGARHSKGALVELVCWLLQKSTPSQQEQVEPDVSNKLKFDCEFVDGTVADLTVYGSKRDIKRLEARIKFWWNLEQHSGTPDSDKGERIIWGKPPQPKQEQGEPVAWISWNRVSGESKLNYHKVSSKHDATLWSHFPLYTTPQQRTWVGLTLEERDHLWEVSRAGLPRYNTFAGLVESKLKEKNGF